MSSNTSENEIVDIGPVNGSRSIGPVAPQNPGFDLEASLSRLEPPRHRLVPVERVDGVRVERSEKVTVERADIEGGQSETVKIERTETVYDDESDSVRIERSETVRVERIHTSQYDELPSLLDGSSSTEAAQHILDDSVDVKTPAARRTTPAPDRPPPPGDGSELSEVIEPEPLDRYGADETIIEAQTPSKVDEVLAKKSVLEDLTQPADPPAHASEVVEVSSDEMDPAAFRGRSGRTASQRRPAFFVRGQSSPAADDSNQPSQENQVIPPPVGSGRNGSLGDVAPPVGSGRNGSLGDVAPPVGSGRNGSLGDVAPPVGSGRNGSLGDVAPPVGSGRNGSLGDVAPRRVDSRPRPPVVGENTGPIDINQVAEYGSPKSHPDPLPKPVTENTGSVDAVKMNGFSPPTGHGPNLEPPVAVPLEIPEPGPKINRTTSHPAPPEFKPAQKNEPRFEPSAQVPSTSASAEHDAFDDYLNDPLGFFDPSEEIEAVRSPWNKPGSAGLEGHSGAINKAVPRNDLGRQNGSRREPNAGRVRASGNSQPQQRRGGPTQKQDGRGSRPVQPHGGSPDGRDRTPPTRGKRRPTTPARSSSRAHGQRPLTMRGGNRQEEFDEQYDDDLGDSDDTDSRRFGYLRSKIGTILAGGVGVVLIGLSAIFVFSGDDAPDGEILESEGFYWWVDGESSSKSFIPESCADSLQSLGADKSTVPFSELEEIPRDDVACEEILSPGS